MASEIAPAMAAISGGLALLAVFLVSLAAHLLFRKMSNNENGFFDILRDDNLKLSLSRVQLLVWIWVILFAFTWVFFIKFFSDPIPDLANITLPSNTLALLGISAASPITSQGMDRFKPSGTKNISKRTYMQGGRSLPSFGSMLKDKEDSAKPTITRFQMFAWTWIALLVYLATVFVAVSLNLTQTELLTLPDVSTTMTLLMGISQGTYLAGKAASQ